jgi:dTDP-4-dehydrorhamnose 3,5-epimerase-like enzyme
MSNLDKCHIVELPQLRDDRGSLTYIQPPLLPFEIQRVYYLYDIPSTKARGAHGHRRLQQLMIAIAGSVDVELDDGRQKRVFHLSSPDQALYVAPMIWRDLTNFAPGTACLVLASELYDESDYFRDYGEFLSEVDNA